MGDAVATRGTTASQHAFLPKPPSLALFHFRSPLSHTVLCTPLLFLLLSRLLFHSPVWRYTGQISPHAEAQDNTCFLPPADSVGQEFRKHTGWPDSPPPCWGWAETRLYLSAIHSRILGCFLTAWGCQGMWAPRASVAAHMARDFLPQK